MNFDTASATEILAALAAGTTTSVALVAAYQQRIAAFSVVNAVQCLNPAAAEAAAASDARRARGEARLLEGLPVLVKDNIDVAGLATTAGSLALADFVPERDAGVITALHAAGAIILGKVKLSEFANFTTYGAPDGFSSLGGQVLNPYDLRFNISGSSSGSAAAMAVGLAAATLGTETSGSILCPASRASVVGLKPTVGLVPGEGILPIASTQDTAGPITRTVADAALLLDALVSPGHSVRSELLHGSYLATCTAGAEALRGARLGVVTQGASAIGVPDDAAAFGPEYEGALLVLRQAGAELVPVSVPEVEVPLILFYEFKRDLNAYFAAHGSHMTLAEVIAFNTAHPVECLKFGQGILVDSEAVDLEADAQAYEIDRDRGLAVARAALDDQFAKHQVDAIVSPNTLWHIGGRAGYPGITVPAGYTGHGSRPHAVSFSGSANSEAQLLRYAYAFEQAVCAWRPAVDVNPGLRNHGQPTV